MLDDERRESILLSIKKLIGGLDSTSSEFDDDLVIFINSTFSVLNQLGVGPKKPFSISDEYAEWSEFECNNIEAVKEYMYLKVRLVFDPPSSGSVMDAFKRRADELEWRMNVMSEEATDGTE